MLRMLPKGARSVLLQALLCSLAAGAVIVCQRHLADTWYPPPWATAIEKMESEGLAWRVELLPDEPNFRRFWLCVVCIPTVLYLALLSVCAVQALRCGLSKRSWSAIVWIGPTLVLFFGLHNSLVFWLREVVD